MRRLALGLAGTAAVAALVPATAAAAPNVRTAAGSDPAAITGARDAFRADLGGGTIPGANGLFGTERREINWDGVPDARSAPDNLPGDFFAVRGARFETPGSAVQVSGDDDNPVDPDPDQLRFDNLNPTYSATFKAFSPQRLFTAVGSNIVDVKFFVPGTDTPASVSGFGSVFTDVDAADTTAIEYYGEDGRKIATYSAPPADDGLSFVGASNLDGGRISRVRIRSGNTAPGPADADATADVVAMDDFLYGEPAAIRAPAPPPNPGQGQGTPPQGTPPQVTPPPVVPPVLDNVPPSLRAAVRSAVRLRTLRRGLKASATSNEASVLRFELRGKPRKAGRTVTLATKRLGLGTGRRTATLRPRRRTLAGADRRFALNLRVVATDEAGNSSVKRAKVIVRR